MTEPGPPPWRSAAEDLLARAESEYDRAHARFDTVDGKAALVLGFGAGLLGLTFDVQPTATLPGWLLLAGRVAAVVAVGTALRAAWPRGYRVLKVRKVWENMDDVGADVGLLDLLDQRIVDVESVSAAAGHKLSWLQGALVALSLAAALIGSAAVATGAPMSPTPTPTTTPTPQGAPSE